MKCKSILHAGIYGILVNKVGVDLTLSNITRCSVLYYQISEHVNDVRIEVSPLWRGPRNIPHVSLWASSPPFLCLFVRQTPTVKFFRSPTSETWALQRGCDYSKTIIINGLKILCHLNFF